MVDRASTFANPQIIEQLKNDFVTVAIDQAYQRRQKDAEGDFFRKVARSRGWKSNGQTAQGMYIASANGELLAFTNHRSPQRVLRVLTGIPREPKSAAEIQDGPRDRQFNPDLPQDGLVIRANAKVLSGYDKPQNDHDRAMQNAISRDNFWIWKDEHKAIARGEMPQTVARRFARYHLVDNTRGEPEMWRVDEVKRIDIKLDGSRLTGDFELQTADGKRRFNGKLFGYVETKDGRVTRFDVVAKGLFRGHGRYTRKPPRGDFPVAIAFTLADMKDVADRIPPQGSRGWIRGYREAK